jgi:hypothetical protein
LTTFPRYSTKVGRSVFDGILLAIDFTARLDIMEDMGERWST